jgi:hypothetical protein
MDTSLIQLLNEIRASDASVIYSSLRNLFKYINAPFCKFDMIAGHPPLFRVRSHTKGDGNYFFENISDVSFRSDILNIKQFGRCNEPFQSRFYASDNEILAFAEVSELVRTENKKDTSYHTTSVWKLNHNIMISPIFEPDNVDVENLDLVEVTKKCFEIIEATNQIPQKEDLKLLLKGLANEFTKPFALDNRTYLFSAAFANYLFETVPIGINQIDGIVYPSCLDKPAIRNLGLNYVIQNSIVGVNNKLELVDVYRSRLDKNNKRYDEAETIYCKRINNQTGKIEW